MADSSMFAPNSDCDSCNHLIYFDPNSNTGASATPPCLIWSDTCPQGFSIRARNNGTCRLQVYARTINNGNGNGIGGNNNSPWGELGASIALLNTDGTQVFTEDGIPITARPFEPIGVIDQNNFEITKIEPIYTAIGVLCIQTSPTICPICNVNLVLSFPNGEESEYRVGTERFFNRGGSMGTTIRGTVDCRNTGDDTLNITNLRARLISCPECSTDQVNVFSTVPLQISSNVNSNTEATYEFKNIRGISCFRVEIICVAPTATLTNSSSSASTSASSASNIRRGLVLNTRSQANLLTSRNVLASSECKLINDQNIFTVPPLFIDCNACQDTTVTVNGTVVCRGSTTATTLTDNITVQFISCETKNGGGSIDIKCGTSGTSACGSPLMVSPTYQAPLNSNGTFSASVPIGCYLIRFVCTSSPTTILTIVSPSSLITGTGCNYYCLSTTNLGTITLSNCNTCPLTQVAIQGTVVCSSTGTVDGLQSGMTAQLIACNSTCTSLATPLNIVATDEINTTTGLYDFGSVDAGCYQIRIVCSSCTSDSTVIATIPCTNYGALTNIVPVVSIDCITCSTVSLSGTVTCTSGSSGLTNVQLQITQYPNGCDSSEGKTISFITPSTSTGAYSICLPIDIGYTIQAVCASTGTALTNATACTSITTDSIVDITITDCTCTTASTATLTSTVAAATTMRSSATSAGASIILPPQSAASKSQFQFKTRPKLPPQKYKSQSQSQYQYQQPQRNIKLSTMSFKKSELKSQPLNNDHIHDNDNDNADEKDNFETKSSTSTQPRTFANIRGYINNLKANCIVVIRLKSHTQEHKNYPAQIYIPHHLNNPNNTIQNAGEKEDNLSSESNWEWSGQVIKNESYRIDYALNDRTSLNHMIILASMLVEINEEDTQIVMNF